VLQSEEHGHVVGHPPAALGNEAVPPPVGSTSGPSRKRKAREEDQEGGEREKKYQCSLCKQK
jgi:hypothetical protein